ncbi:hypothetical protein N7478_002669 [Penicillium angulare]|uniref:uncharacterized protein n=1 Tax=Penicillium angulare TaxID=116970 RepID=UPI002540D179|nr:uncharacterized protein N7478_002669 [Penicillium angulare]KAJ5286983.1 hypothetical protein N7478_002669 [Penicillium angulare]
MLSSDLRNALHVTATLSGLLILFTTFLLSHRNSLQSNPVPRTRYFVRTFLAWLAALAFASESLFLATGSYEFEYSLNQNIAVVFYATGWALISLRKTPIFGEGISFCVISVFYSSILTVLDWSSKEKVLPSIQISRLVIILALFIDYILQWASFRLSHMLKDEQHSAEEAQPFLGHATTENCLSYGTAAKTADPQFENSDSESDDEYGRSASSKGKQQKTGNIWASYRDGIKLMMPYVVPRQDRKVQACVAVCLGCLVANRFLNILVPRQLGIVADKLFAGQLPYKDLVIYWALYILHDDAGLGLIQSLAKIPIQQFSYREITKAAFSHVMGLSMEFHSSRDSAEVMTTIEQGRSFTRVLEVMILEIIPMLFDFVIAFGVLIFKFHSSVALCMVIASFIFLTLQIITSSWNIRFRRKLMRSMRKQARRMHQAVESWQTVASFNMFDYEDDRFGNAVDTYLTRKLTWSTRDAFTSALTEIIMPTNFLLLSSLVVYEIYSKQATPGDFVFLLQYWSYFVWPIRGLSYRYRSIIANLTDAERLITLMKTPPTVCDQEGALSLTGINGHIVFENVSFSYDNKRQSTENINISASPGETIALVGRTGSGKSTLMKLLMRFYDVSAGKITIDGHDLRAITLGSLRDSIGIVPQDPLLFNSSIMENLRYARIDATDEEIHEACRSAAIHDKILTFPSGYQTHVGEHGVKLSGGEVQRLAVARAFLKDAPVLILDEATSSVDTETENIIQDALRKLREKRTTFVLAHRLSTIMDADRILVIEDGRLAEQGTHKELLQAGGRYNRFWEAQFGKSSSDIVSFSD